MQSLYQRLTTPSTALNNLYLHVTFACPLRCTHCYAQGGEARRGALSVSDRERACREAAALGFRHVVITGGEPLAHPQRDALLDVLAGLRGEVKPLLTVLRTSLALPMDPALLRRVAHSTDEVVVSVDGDRETHDVRRGAGSYDLTVGNLRALVKLGLSTDLSLAAVLPLEQANGAPGEAVRALAKELGIRRTRSGPCCRWAGRSTPSWTSCRRRCGATSTRARWWSTASAPWPRAASGRTCMSSRTARPIPVTPGTARAGASV